jgi:hypothetical protein
VLSQKSVGIDDDPHIDPASNKMKLIACSKRSVCHPQSPVPTMSLVHQALGLHGRGEGPDRAAGSRLLLIESDGDDCTKEAAPRRHSRRLLLSVLPRPPLRHTPTQRCHCFHGPYDVSSPILEMIRQRSHRLRLGVSP